MKLPALKALSYPSFRTLWTAMFLSRIGTEMQNVGINWHIYTLTKSPLALGLIGLCRILPILVFSLLGGIAADHFNRKKLLLITQSLSFLFAVTLTVATIARVENVVLLYFLIALNAGIYAFDNPARQSLVPHLVPKHDFIHAVSLNSISYQLSLIVGPALGGFVIAYIGVAGTYAVNTITFLVVIGSILFISLPHTPPDHNTISLTGLKEGVMFVAKTPLLWGTMVLDFFATLFGSAMTLMPIFATEILHVGPRELGLLYTAPSVGAIIVGILFSSLNTSQSQGKAMLIGITLYGFATMIFGISQFFVLSLIALCIVGAGDMVSSIVRNTLRQMITPDQLRGRMVSINMMFYMGGPQLGELESGILASIIGAPLTVVFGGLGTLFVTLFMAKKVPELIRYKNHLEVE